MSERMCVNCKKKRLKLPHWRVWEERKDESSMLCFCSKKCLVEWYTPDEYGRTKVL